MRIVIGEGSCGIAAGAQKVRSALEALITEPIGSTGCIGMCYLEPIVDLYEGKDLVRRLVRVSDKDAEAIAEAVKTGDLSKVDSITIIGNYISTFNCLTNPNFIAYFTYKISRCL